MADEIVAVYRAEVEQYKKAVDDLTSKVNALDKAQNKVGDDAQADFGKGAKAVGGMSASVTSLTTQMKSLAAAVGIAFTLDRVVAFARESVKLAASAEGVERAFKRIGSPQILDGLRKATRGTVTDLQLMQNAVKASNFQIPLDQLASLFAFAQARARETGESVDYLVDSIILGIGRKSPLILDNLGISAVALREKFAGLSAEQASVGDVARAVGEIATAEMAKMGTQADTTADHIAQLSTKWDNIKQSIGAAVIEAAKFFEIIDDSQSKAGLLRTEERAKQVSYALGVVTNEMRGINDETVKQQALEEKLAQKRTESQRLLKTIQDIEAQRVAITAKVAAAETVYQNASNSNLKFRSAAAKEQIAQAGKIIEDGNKELSILKEQRKESIEKLSWTSAYIAATEQLIGKKEKSNALDANEIRNVFFYTKAIKDLTEEQEAQGTSVERVYEINKLLPPLREELARLIGQETEATRKAREEAEKAAKAEKDRIDNARRMQEEYTAAFLETMNMRMDAINAFYDEQQISATREIADAQERARVLEEIERNRLREQITLLQGFGLAATSERLKLAQSEAKILDDADALYKRFLEGQDADHAASLEKRKKAEQEARDEDLANAEMFFGQLLEINNAITSAIMAGHEQEQASLDNQLEAGQISREQYDQRRRQLEREKAQDAKTAAIFNAVIGTALAVVNALAVGPPQGYILAALSAALGAVEIGVISAQPLPQFAKGVIGLQGAGTETSDSITARLSKGESVMTAAETKKYRPLLEGMRNGTLGDIIRETYVRPAIDAAMLSGFADMGRSAELNGLTAKLSDHNIIAAMDRNRSATVYGLKMLADKLDKRTQKRGGYA
jgi:hypothetical protein